MAAGNFTLFDIAVEKIAKGIHDLDTHSFRIMLTTSAQALAKTFVGTSTDCRRADLTAEVAAGGGYTTTGQALSGVSVTRSGGVVTFDATDTTWATATLTAKYAVIYNDTATNKDLLGFVDLETTGSVSPSNGDLVIQWNASGIFTLTS